MNKVASVSSYIAHEHTKHCYYRVCRSDSRYGCREHIKGVSSMPFPKPHIDLAKSERCVKACKRELFVINNITKHTYICSLHFIGLTWPTDEYPDPVDSSPAQGRHLYNRLGQTMSMRLSVVTVTCPRVWLMTYVYVDD